MDQRELTLAIVGIDFANADGSSRRFELEICRPGEPVELRPEPKNKHDRNAVAVLSARGWQLGYLSAERAPWIGAKIKGGEEVTAIFQGVQGRAGYIRARFGGGAPTLPPTRAIAEQDPDFDADPDPGMWGA